MRRKFEILLVAIVVYSFCQTSVCVDVRLADGLQLHKGRVEILFDDVWGTICSEGWDDFDATVVCRMLGFEHGKAYVDGFFGRGEGPVWLSDVKCDDSYWFGTLPSDIEECEHAGWSQNNCTHSLDAGVWCVEENDVILVNGTQNMGRVEIYHSATFGTICHDNFDDADANVVCKMSGFRSGGIAYHGAVFGEGSGQIWMNDLQCSGEEKRLEDCQHSNWFSGDCMHSEDVGVYCYRGLWSSWSACSRTCGSSVRMRRIMCVGADMNSRCRMRSETENCNNPPCIHTKIRLRGSEHEDRGRVEVYHSYRWGTICDDEWGDTEATLICRMMGFLAGKAYKGSFFGRGSGKIWMDDVNCSPSYQGGFPGDIVDCSHRGWGRHNCNHDEDAGVWCVRKENDLVLVNGSESSGRVEIYHSHSFGTVCDSNFYDYVNADVICGMVGYRGGRAYRRAHFGRGFGVIWLSNINCSRTYSGKSASKIADCYHDGWGIVNCHHGRDVGVKCFHKLDGGWNSWSSWTACSASCDLGTHSRERVCTDPAPRFGGKYCSGISQEEDVCDSGAPCPVNGSWTNWSSWSTCSATCEFGSRFRSRECSNPSPKFGGRDCEGTDIYNALCTVGRRCPIHGLWSEWTSWSFCSVTCSNGTQRRWRFCDSPSPRFGGKVCEGEGRDVADCYGGVECPVHGLWGSWSEWGLCTVTCGSGFQKRFRMCDSPPPSKNGHFCLGGNTDFRPCEAGRVCPVDGAWSAWSDWTACTVTCEVGIRQRNRACDSPLSSFGGRECVGLAIDTQPCNAGRQCLIHGSLGEWSAWSACSVPCAVGIRRRSRVCDSPAPKFNCDVCFGGENETVNCDTGIPCTYDRCTLGKCHNGQHVSCLEISCKMLTTPTRNYGNDILPVHKTINAAGKVSPHKHGHFTDDLGNGKLVLSEKKLSTLPNLLEVIGDVKENTNRNKTTTITSTQENMTSSQVNVGTSSLLYGNSNDYRHRIPVAEPNSYNETVLFNDTNVKSTDTTPLPLNNETVPFSKYTAPFSNDTAPFNNNTVPFGVNMKPYNNRTMLFNNETLFSNETTPLNRTTTSFSNGVKALNNKTAIVYNETVPINVDRAPSSNETSRVIDEPKPPASFASWNRWSEWSACSVTCSIGVKKRFRTCTNGLSDNIALESGVCRGKKEDISMCITGISCAVSSTWKEWTSWSSCSVSCGFGTRRRSRMCMNNLLQIGRYRCEGNDFEIETCSQDVPCKGQEKIYEATWNDWSEWTSCSVSCENGTRHRSRECNNPSNLDICEGESRESHKCSVDVLCPVDGIWSEWTPWTLCSVSCGDAGKSRRFRECNKPLPVFGGKECTGHAMEVIDCNKSVTCSMDGGWGEWSPWTRCSVSCGEGQRTRHRRCDNPAPRPDGPLCEGDHTAVQNCETGKVCPDY